MNTTAATPTRRITAALYSGRDAMAGRRGRVHGDRSIAPNGARPARVAKQFTAGVAPLHAGSAAARAVVCGGGQGDAALAALVHPSRGGWPKAPAHIGGHQ